MPCVVWIATTFNSDYLKMRGWKSVISSTDHRQEFVAGNLAYHAMSGIIMIIWFWSLPCSIAFAEFKQASEKVGSHDADWNEIEDMIDIRGYGRRNFYQPLSHIPQVSKVKRCTQPSSHNHPSRGCRLSSPSAQRTTLLLSLSHLPHLLSFKALLGSSYGGFRTFFAIRANLRSNSELSAKYTRSSTFRISFLTV